MITLAVFPLDFFRQLPSSHNLVVIRAKYEAKDEECTTSTTSSDTRVVQIHPSVKGIQ